MQILFDSVVFGQNIKELREQFGLQRQAFADLCGISIYTLRSYQSGEIMPSMKALLKICNRCNVSPNTLLKGIYPSPTEVDDINLIRSTTLVLPDERRVYFEDLIDIVATCMVQSAPILEGADLGGRIKILREDIGLSQKDFASHCKITTGTMSCIESNQVLPGLEVVLASCQILHITPEFLLYPNLKEVKFENEKYFGLTVRQIACLAKLAILIK